MTDNQITAASATKLLKDGLTLSGTVIQPGFKLSDAVIAQVSIVHMDELGEWYEDDFSTLLASLKGQKVAVPVAPFAPRWTTAHDALPLEQDSCLLRHPHCEVDDVRPNRALQPKPNRDHTLRV